MHALILAGFALLADQLTKDAALFGGRAVVVEAGGLTALAAGLALAGLALARVRGRRPAGLALAAAGVASAVLDPLVHGGLVFPWQIHGVGLSVGALTLVSGLVATGLALLVTGGTMKPKLPSAKALRGAPRGMTLIEILVVIAIIGIVATVVAVGVVGFLADAKKESARTLVDNVAKGVASYAVTHRRLPKDLNELVDKKYIKKNQTKDPWDNELEYRPGSGSDIDDFTLCSKGPDGTSGSDDDICSGDDRD